MNSAVPHRRDGLVARLALADSWSPTNAIAKACIALRLKFGTTSREDETRSYTTSE